MQAPPSHSPFDDRRLADTRILLADDEEIVRTVVRLTLEALGARFLETDNGSEALRLAREHSPDIAILDWMMPGLSGIDVVEALKAEPRTWSVRSILLTANGEPRHRDEGFRAGAHSYLVKPFSPRELVRVVESTLRFDRPTDGARVIERPLELAHMEIA